VCSSDLKKEGTVKRLLSIVSLTLAAGCVGIASRPSADLAPAGDWRGYVLHDGLRAGILVSLHDDHGAWNGTLSDGDNAVRLSGVAIAGSRVHFEQGDTAFDGSVAGSSMSGTVSGAQAGSFALDRQPDWDPYPSGP